MRLRKRGRQRPREPRPEQPDTGPCVPAMPSSHLFSPWGLCFSFLLPLSAHSQPLRLEPVGRLLASGLAHVLGILWLVPPQQTDPLSPNPSSSESCLSWPGGLWSGLAGQRCLISDVRALVSSVRSSPSASPVLTGLVTHACLWSGSVLSCQHSPAAGLAAVVDWGPLSLSCPFVYALEPQRSPSWI